MKNRPQTKDIPFIMLTAEAEMDNVMEAIQLGVNSYIIQPFEEGQLAEKIKHVWNKIYAGSI